MGAAIGGAIGRSMDETDRLKTTHALETVRTGVPSSWHNPDTGSAYTVVPTRTYETEMGPCREHTIDAIIGGRQEQLYGASIRTEPGGYKAEPRAPATPGECSVVPICPADLVTPGDECRSAPPLGQPCGPQVTAWAGIHLAQNVAPASVLPGSRSFRK